MHFQTKPRVTFAELKAAFEPLGLAVQETRMDSHSSAVKLVHDGVPYTIDCYHKLEKVAACAAKFYILLERHHCCTSARAAGQRFTRAPCEQHRHPQLL